jgi:hypothetical protein
MQVFISSLNWRKVDRMQIELTRNLVAIVDADDFDYLSQFKWCSNHTPRTFYALRFVRRNDGRQGVEYMHRTVLQRKLGRALANGEQVDHINGDGLDNRRINLRPATNAQNGRNCRRRASTTSSQYLGVRSDKQSGKWCSNICTPGKRVHLGYFLTEVDAMLAREKYIAAHPELMARSNIVDESCS